ncbi:hypothetical protein CRI64_15565 [Escherichia sp. E2748]|nr:hypothetical protein CRI64_15565 [Escherichia sp. E2748]
MFAVVPCQWWRIIGSYSEETSGKYKKFIVRSILKQNTLKTTISGWKLDKKRAPKDSLVLFTGRRRSGLH